MLSNIDGTNDFEATQFWFQLKKWGSLKNCTCNGGGWFGVTGAGYQDTTSPKSAYYSNSRWIAGRDGQGTYYPGALTNKNYFSLRANNGTWDYHLAFRSLFWGASHADGELILDAIVVPADALAMDLKIDDGSPLTGKVLSTNNAGGADVAPYTPQYRYCLSATGYYLGYNSHEHGCMMLFEMDEVNN